MIGSEDFNVSVIIPVFNAEKFKNKFYLNFLQKPFQTMSKFNFSFIYCNAYI